MNNTIRLQVPLSKELKIRGLKQAKKYGYSSLQEVVRVFLSGFVDGKFVPTFSSTKRETLSPEAQKRYARMIKEHEDQRKRGEVKFFSDADEALEFLNEKERD